MEAKTRMTHRPWQRQLTAWNQEATELLRSPRGGFIIHQAFQVWRRALEATGKPLPPGLIDVAESLGSRRIAKGSDAEQLVVGALLYGSRALAEEPYPQFSNIEDMRLLLTLFPGVLVEERLWTDLPTDPEMH